MGSRTVCSHTNSPSADNAAPANEEMVIIGSSASDDEVTIGGDVARSQRHAAEAVGVGDGGSSVTVAIAEEPSTSVIEREKNRVKW